MSKHFFFKIDIFVQPAGKPRLARGPAGLFLTRADTGRLARRSTDPQAITNNK